MKNKLTAVSLRLVTYDGEVRWHTTGFYPFRLDGTSSQEPSFISEESFVRAPLNSRIVSSTTTAKSKGKAKEESLDSFPLEVQEALILEDLLFVLMVCDLLPLAFRCSWTR